MALERTLSIVKPDGVARNLIGDVYHRFEKAGLRIVAARMLHLTTAQAEGFYAVHRERGFFKDLVSYMSSGPVIAQVLEGENAVQAARVVFLIGSGMMLAIAVFSSRTLPDQGWSLSTASASAESTFSPRKDAAKAGMSAVRSHSGGCSTCSTASA